MITDIELSFILDSVAGDEANVVALCKKYPELHITAVTAMRSSQARALVEEIRFLRKQLESLESR